MGCPFEIPGVHLIQHARLLYFPLEKFALVCLIGLVATFMSKTIVSASFHTLLLSCVYESLMEE